MPSSKERSTTHSRRAFTPRPEANAAAAVARRKQTMKNVARQAANLGKALSKARANANATRRQTANRWKTAQATLQRTAPQVAAVSKRVNRQFIDHAMNLTSQIQRAAAAALKRLTGRN